MPSSSAYPGLKRDSKKNSNWVEAAGGLPKYIERIAKHLHYEKGHSISSAIAMAVNTVKRWAKGTNHNGGKLTPKTVAQAQAAVAEWNKIKAKSKSKAIRESRRFPTVKPTDEEFASLYSAARAGRTFVEGLLEATEGDDVRATTVTSARDLLEGRPQRITLSPVPADPEAVVEVREALAAELDELTGLMEGIAPPAIKQAERGKKAKQPKPKPGKEPEAAEPMPLPNDPDETRTTHLQNRLSSLGYGLVGDGHFGPKTHDAVTKFQTEQGLKADGIVGPITTASLRSASPVSNDTEVNPDDPSLDVGGPEAEDVSARPVLFKGAGVGEEEPNADVDSLQGQLGELGYAIAQDGRFGPETDKAVKRMQRKYGLKPDGIVGPKTHRTLAGAVGFHAEEVQEADVEAHIRHVGGKLVYVGPYSRQRAMRERQIAHQISAGGVKGVGRGGARGVADPLAKARLAHMMSPANEDMVVHVAARPTNDGMFTAGIGLDSDDTRLVGHTSTTLNDMEKGAFWNAQKSDVVTIEVPKGHPVYRRNDRKEVVGPDPFPMEQEVVLPHGTRLKKIGEERDENGRRIVRYRAQRATLQECILRESVFLRQVAEGRHPLVEGISVRGYTRRVGGKVVQVGGYDRAGTARADLHDSGRGAVVAARRKKDEAAAAKRRAESRAAIAAHEASKPMPEDYPDTPEGFGQFVTDAVKWRNGPISQMDAALDRFSDDASHQAYIRKLIRPTSNGFAWDTIEGYEAVDKHDPNVRGGIVTEWHKINPEEDLNPASARRRKRRVADKVSTESPTRMVGTDRVRLAKLAKPIESDMSLFHGSKGDFLGGEVGEVRTITRSLSSSGTEDVARSSGHDTVYHFLAPEGTKTFRPSDVNGVFVEEDEHVLLKNTKVKIRRREKKKGVTHVYADIVPGGGSRLTEAQIAVEVQRWLLEYARRSNGEFSLEEAFSRGSASAKVITLKRLPDGTFAPKGLGQVLKPGDKVQVPHKHNEGEMVTGVVGDKFPQAIKGTLKVTLDHGPDEGQPFVVAASKDFKNTAKPAAPKSPGTSGDEKSQAKQKTAWAAFDKKMAQFTKAKEDGAEKGELAKLASQVRAAKWSIKRAGGDPNNRPDFAGQGHEGDDPGVPKGEAAAPKSKNDEIAEKQAAMGKKHFEANDAKQAKANKNAADTTKKGMGPGSADPKVAHAEKVAVENDKKNAKAEPEIPAELKKWLGTPVLQGKKFGDAKGEITGIYPHASGDHEKAKIGVTVGDGPEKKITFNQLGDILAGKKGLPGSTPAASEPDPVSEEEPGLSDDEMGDHLSVGTAMQEMWGEDDDTAMEFVDGHPEEGEWEKAKDAFKQAVQEEGEGQFTPAMKEAFAVLKKRFPGEDWGTDAGDEPVEQAGVPTPARSGGDVPEDEDEPAVSSKASVDAALKQKAGEVATAHVEQEGGTDAAKNAALEAYKAQGGDDPAIIAMLTGGAPEAAPEAAPEVPAAPAPAAGDPAASGLQPNKTGINLASMAPGTVFEDTKGLQWVYHKPTSGGVFHIVKPGEGNPGKAKPFHGKMEPPLVGAAGAPAAPAAPAPSAKDDDDLFGKLSASVDAVKAGKAKPKVESYDTKKGPSAEQKKANAAKMGKPSPSVSTAPHKPSAHGAGRGPTGKLRNFKAMSKAKLQGVIAEIESEGHDDEALAAAKAALQQK